MRARIAQSQPASAAARGLPVTEAYLGLHIGEVFYGNIGSQDRLDFTVVGPAVNEASRIAAMCRSAEQDVLISSAFAAAALEDRIGRGCVSVGRYALQGRRAQRRSCSRSNAPIEPAGSAREPPLARLDRPDFALHSAGALNGASSASSAGRWRRGRLSLSTSQRIAT